jgi:hypothetical protein
MNPEDIRSRNLRKLIAERYDGNNSAFARTVGWAPTYVFRYFTNVEVHRRHMTSATARRLEEKIGLESGWLDRDHSNIGRFVHTAKTTQKAVFLQWSDLENLEQALMIKQKDSEAVGFLCPVPHSSHTYVVEVLDDSMFNPGGEPSFSKGDHLFVDPQVPLTSGRCIALWDDRARMGLCRQYVVEGGQKILKAVNKHWPDPIEVLNEHYRICGTVIGRFQPL